MLSPKKEINFIVPQCTYVRTSKGIGACIALGKSFKPFFLNMNYAARITSMHIEVHVRTISWLTMTFEKTMLGRFRKEMKNTLAFDWKFGDFGRTFVSFDRILSCVPTCT